MCPVSSLLSVIARIHLVRDLGVVAHRTLCRSAHGSGVRRSSNRSRDACSRVFVPCGNSKVSSRSKNQDRTHGQQRRRQETSRKPNPSRKPRATPGFRRRPPRHRRKRRPREGQGTRRLPPLPSRSPRKRSPRRRLVPPPTPGSSTSRSSTASFYRGTAARSAQGAHGPVERGEDHGGVTVEELKALYTDWKTAREKPAKKKAVAV